MYPHERSLVKKYKNQPFAIIGVNSDRDLEKVRPELEKENVTWRSFWDESTSGPIAKSWGDRGWPTIYVLDHEGKIRFKDVRGSRLDKAVETLMAEVEKPGK